MKVVFGISKKQVTNFNELTRDLHRLVRGHADYVSGRRYGHHPFNTNQHFEVEADSFVAIVTVTGERCALMEYLTPALLQLFADHGLCDSATLEQIEYYSEAPELLWHEDMCAFVARVGLESPRVRQGALEAMGTCRFRDATDEGFPVVHVELLMGHVHYWKQEAGKLIWGTLTPEQKLMHQALAEAYMNV